MLFHTTFEFKVSLNLASETLDTLLSIAEPGSQRRPSLGSSSGIPSYPPIDFADEHMLSSRSSDTGSESLSPWVSVSDSSIRRKKWKEAMSESDKAEREAHARQSFWRAITATTTQSFVRPSPNCPELPGAKEAGQLPLLKARTAYSARPANATNGLYDKGAWTISIAFAVSSPNSDSVLKISRIAKGVECSELDCIRAELARRHYEQSEEANEGVSVFQFLVGMLYQYLSR